MLLFLPQRKVSALGNKQKLFSHILFFKSSLYIYIYIIWLKYDYWNIE